MRLFSKFKKNKRPEDQTQAFINKILVGDIDVKGRVVIKAPKVTPSTIVINVDTEKSNVS